MAAAVDMAAAAVAERTAAALEVEGDIAADSAAVTLQDSLAAVTLQDSPVAVALQDSGAAGSAAVTLLALLAVARWWEAPMDSRVVVVRITLLADTHQVFAAAMPAEVSPPSTRTDM